MNILLILAMLVLLFLVLLPFWLAVPGKSKDGRLIKEVLPPGQRRYSLLLPEGYQGDTPVPLVFALHYSGHGLPFYGELFLTELIGPALSKLGAIMVAPDCPAKDWTCPESEAFVLNLLDFIESNYDIDPSRVLLTGFSMGGIGTWHLASKFQDRFTAALVMAAGSPEDTLTTDWTLPLYVIHAREDQLFPIANTTRAVVNLEESGVDITYRILEHTTHYETQKFIIPLQDAASWIIEHWENRPSKI
jgi:predicted peptidase